MKAICIKCWNPDAVVTMDLDGTKEFQCVECEERFTCGDVRETLEAMKKGWEKLTTAQVIEKLKADRRAEIEAAKAEEENRLREEEEKKRREWERGIAAAVVELGVIWLAEYRAAEADGVQFSACAGRTFREAAFRIPCHRVIVLRMHAIGYTDVLWEAWTLHPNMIQTWGVVSGSAVTGCDSLADALIAAELKPGETDEEIPF